MISLYIMSLLGFWPPLPDMTKCKCQMSDLIRLCFEKRIISMNIIDINNHGCCSLGNSPESCSILVEELVLQELLKDHR